MRFYKYGRWWYSTRTEADDNRNNNEPIFFDSGMNAYYLGRPRKSFWNW